MNVFLLYLSNGSVNTDEKKNCVIQTPNVLFTFEFVFGSERRIIKWSETPFSRCSLTGENPVVTISPHVPLDFLICFSIQKRISDPRSLLNYSRAIELEIFLGTCFSTQWFDWISLNCDLCVHSMLTVIHFQATRTLIPYIIVHLMLKQAPVSV